MFKAYNPSTIAPPYKNIYTQAIEVPANARTLYLSGCLGIAPDGKTPAGIEEQSELVMFNMNEQLKAAGMTMANLVRMNAFILKQEYVPAFAVARAKWLNGAKPTMTTVVVPDLAAPGWLIEVDCIAAAV